MSEADGIPGDKCLHNTGPRASTKPQTPMAVLYHVGEGEPPTFYAPAAVGSSAYGKLNTKVEPIPGAEVSPIRPPSASTICLPTYRSRLIVPTYPRAPDGTTS